MDLDVCICTHNPRREVLSLALASLTRQTVGNRAFRVLVVDNASDPPLSDGILSPLRDVGIEARVVREPQPGLARARLRAFGETQGDWLLFVDDDNELMPNYIAEGVRFAGSHPDVGCFGGKLLLPPELLAAAWTKPFLPYLGIKDAGEEVILAKSSDWGLWEPAGAGAFVQRCVVNKYRERSESDAELFRLGREGRRNLASCDDSLIMRGAYGLGLANAYDPALVLYHHLDPRRFRLSYLIRLMYAYGVSHVVLESLIKGRQTVPEYYARKRRTAKLLLSAARKGAQQSIPFMLGLMAYHFGARVEHLRQVQSRVS